MDPALVASVLFFAGAAWQLIGLRSGAFATGRPRRDRLRYVVPSVACFVCAVVLVLAGT